MNDFDIDPRDLPMTADEIATYRRDLASEALDQWIDDHLDEINEPLTDAQIKRLHEQGVEQIVIDAFLGLHGGRAVLDAMLDAFDRAEARLREGKRE